MKMKSGSLYPTNLPLCSREQIGVMTDALCNSRAEEYVPLKKRRQMEEERRLLLRKRLQVCDLKQETLLADTFSRHGCIFRTTLPRGPSLLFSGAMQASAQQPFADEVDTAQAHPPVDEEAAASAGTASQQPKQSLLAAAAKARKTQPAETEQERQLREEQQIMADLQRKQALRSAMENAQVCSHPAVAVLLSVICTIGCPPSRHVRPAATDLHPRGLSCRQHA